MKAQPDWFRATAAVRATINWLPASPNARLRSFGSATLISGPTLACEKLRECHGLVLGVETIRGLMTAVGLWTPRKQPTAKIHQPRNRRACVGELIQILAGATTSESSVDRRAPLKPSKKTAPNVDGRKRP